MPYKFWADQRAANGNWNYAEHTIANANSNTYLDTGFQWVPNTGNWKVFNNHQQVGTSSGVGAYAGGADVGLEFTDTQVAAVGNGSNWRYNDGVNGSFHSAPIGVNQITAGTNAVITRSGGNAAAHTSNNCNYPQASAPAPKAVTPESATTDIAPKFAQAYGGSPASSASSVATTRSAANALQGADVVGDQPVVLLELKGNFTGKHVSAPKGVDPKSITGNTLTADFDAATGQLLDWRISSTSHALSRLGRVTAR